MVEFAQDYDHVDMAPRKPELVRIEEAAKAVGRNPSTLRRWIAAGLLQGHRSRPGAPKALLVDLNAARAMVKSPPPAEPESRVEPPPGEIRPIRLLLLEEAAAMFSHPVADLLELVSQKRLRLWTLDDGTRYVEYDSARRVLALRPQPAAADDRRPVRKASRAPHPEGPFQPLAAGIIRRGDRVLMTERRFPGYGEVWSWPSGKVEEGESLEQALVRELEEELVITGATVVRHLGDIDLPSGFRMSHYLAQIPPDAMPTLNDYEQLVQYRWLTRPEVERALGSLAPDIARRALEFVDQVLASQPGAPVQPD